MTLTEARSLAVVTRKPHVLFVVSDPDIALPFGEQLESIGVEVALADSIHAARVSVQAQRPDLLLVCGHHVARGGTSFHLLEAIRKLEWSGPSILLSSYCNSKDFCKQCQDAGFSKTLTKPVRGKDLILAVRRVMEHSEAVQVQ